MGTKAAPNYAVNFMNYFEDGFVYPYFLQPIDDIGGDQVISCLAKCRSKIKNSSIYRPRVM